MISKELLSEVLGVYVRDGWYFDCEILIYTYDKILGLDENYHAEINIYELVHKCKEWAYTNHEAVINIFQKTSYNPYTAKLEGKVFQSDTEPEAVFKACEWVLKKMR